jgi:hypothetical protein
VGYRFFKTLDATYISRRQKENKIQVPYWKPTNNKSYGTKCIFHGVLSWRIVQPW